MRFLNKKIYCGVFVVLMTCAYAEGKHKSSLHFLNEQLAVESKKTTTGQLLYMLAEKCERERSLFFLQDYHKELCIVLKELPQFHENEVYKKAVILILVKNFLHIMYTCKMHVFNVMMRLDEAIAYWTFQQNHSLQYWFHKHPKKWFNNELQQEEVKRHIEALEALKKEYEWIVGNFVRHLEQHASSDFPQLCAWMSEGCNLLFALCDSPTASFRAEKNNSIRGVLYMLYKVLSLEPDIETILFNRARRSHMPSHIERYWARYVGICAVVGMVIWEKSKPESKLNAVLRAYNFEVYKDHFVEFCKTYMVSPFKRLINTLFGIPIEKSEEYPKSFASLAQYHDMLNQGLERKRQRGDDKEPENFDIAVKAALPVVGTVKKIFSGSELSEVHLGTDTSARHLLYKIENFLFEGVFACLNLSNEADLTLKLIALTRFSAIISGLYGGIKTVAHYGKKESAQRVCASLLDIKQFFVEHALKYDQQEAVLSDHAYGKLLFLIYKAKKRAASFLSAEQYTAFFKDLHKVTCYTLKWQEKAKMIDIIVEKYRIN